MPTEQSGNNTQENNKDAAVKPDAETLHTTDPQEHMEGPLSSLMQKTGEGMESEGSAEDVKKEKESD